MPPRHEQDQSYAPGVNIAQLLFPDFSLILCGHLICRYTRLGRDIWQPVENLVYFFLFPVLLFYSISRAPLDLHVASSMIGAGVSLGLCGISLCYALPHLPVLRRYIDTHQHAGAAQVAFRFNSFFGLALADRLLGAAGTQQFAVLIGFCVPMFNVAAVWPMARHASNGLGRELARNPLIIATLIVMALSPSYWLAFAVLVIGGFGTAGFGNMQTTLMLTEAPAEMRSRLMGLVTVGIGTGPLGVLVAGLLSDAIGPRGAVLAMAGAGLAATIALAAGLRERSRQIDP